MGENSDNRTAAEFFKDLSTQINLSTAQIHSKCEEVRAMHPEMDDKTVFATMFRKNFRDFANLGEDDSDDVVVIRFMSKAVSKLVDSRLAELMMPSIRVGLLGDESQREMEMEWFGATTDTLDDATLLEKCFCFITKHLPTIADPKQYLDDEVCGKLVRIVRLLFPAPFRIDWSSNSERIDRAANGELDDEDDRSTFSPKSVRDPNEYLESCETDDDTE